MEEFLALLAFEIVREPFHFVRPRERFGLRSERIRHKAQDTVWHEYNATRVAVTRTKGKGEEEKCVGVVGGM
jgi:hypothetical protein